MSYPETPLTRQEMYLDAIARGETDGLPAVPNTRLEMYLDYIARNGGGGGGGEPAQYIKNAAVSDDGLTLTLTKKNGTTVSFSVADIDTAIAALETEVDGKQDTISDLTDIRTGAEKGATSVQTVNGEEPDEDGNVTVTSSEGEYIEAQDHIANVKWGDFVTDQLDDSEELQVNIDETTPLNNRVVRVLVTVVGDNATVQISPFDYWESVKWASGEAPTLASGHVYEIIISQAPNYLFCSYSVYTSD